MKEYAFAENLRKIRQARGFSQSELALKVQLSQQTISSYERCENYPTLDKVYDLAKALNVDINVLISIESEYNNNRAMAKG